MKKTTSGFTIVELLIVIVVIAILAAITVVAYNGVQNRAYDSSIQNDLTNIAKQLELAKIDSTNESYPYGNPALSSAFSVRINKGAYTITPISTYNMVYCVPTSVNPKQYLLLSTGKSGNQYSLENGGTVTKNTGSAWSTSNADVCNTVKPGWISGGAGYSSVDTSTGPWRAWAGGN